MERRRVSKEEVVQKLKDDGDFDRLRVNIIRRLKDNVTPLCCAQYIRVALGPRNHESIDRQEIGVKKRM